MRGGAPLVHGSLVVKSITMLFFILNAFIPSVKIDFAIRIGFGAKCLLALHNENTFERTIVLDVAGKQAGSSQSGHEPQNVGIYNQTFEVG